MYVLTLQLIASTLALQLTKYTFTMSTPTISISGKSFVSGTAATRFMVRGIALATDPTLAVNLNIKDILSNEHNEYFIQSILPKLTSMNVNCVRVYQVDPDNEHNKTMKALEAAGIYVMVGLATSDNSVNQMTGAYTQATFSHGARLVSEFQQYDNTFCFSVGNEVEFPGQQASNLHNDQPKDTDAQVVAATIALQYKVAQAMKSFARDIKAHISSNGYRAIPVGCAMQDGPQSSWGSDNPVAYQRNLIGTNTIAQFYVSGSSDERMDFIGINTYRFVSGNGTADTAYTGLATEASLLPVPVFLSETGAITGADRDWKDVPAMYSVKDIGSQLSGEVAFQMFEQGHGYGIYNVTSPTDYTATAMGGAADLSTEFLAASTATPPAIAATPTSITAPTTMTSPGLSPFTLDWPSLLSLKTYVPPNGTAIITSYAPGNIQVVQQGVVVGNVGKAQDPEHPTTVTVPITVGKALEMQGSFLVKGKPEMESICQVKAEAVLDGCHIANDVNWGYGAACNIYIPVTVKNYATQLVDVVQNNKVVATVPAAPNDATPKTVSVSVIAGDDLLIQTPHPSCTTNCKLPGSSVVAGVVIENNVPWSNSAICSIG